jgi:hypothetical protein
MTLLAEPPAYSANHFEAGTPAGPADPRHNGWVKRRLLSLCRRLASEGGVVGALCLTLYVTVAWLLEMKYHVFDVDAVSRMANAFYVLYSRDPHLGAIGFVWNPLPSISVMPLLLLKDLWFPLVSHNMAGALTSATCMTAAVHQLRCTLREWGVQRAPRLVIVALFALNPMIVYYAGNGMSEALYTVTLLATTRYLSRWLVNDDLASLVYGATALGFAYLARNEAVGPAVASGILVLGVSFFRAAGARKARFMKGLTDTTIYLLPFVVSFAGWATASWVIVGSPFAQFTSVYGTSSEIQALGTKKVSLPVALTFESHAIEYLAPLLPLVALIALTVALHRRDVLVFAPIAVVGASLGFDMAAYVTGSIISSFRYFIEAVPLDILLVGSLFATARARKASTADAGSPTFRRQSTVGGKAPRSKWVAAAGAFAAVIVAVVFLGPSIPTTGAGMFNPVVGNEETHNLGYIFHKHLTAQDRVYKVHYAQVLAIGSYITGMHLPEGSVVVDTFDSCAPEVITTIPDPRVFVITNDRDFKAVLADPPQFHARYMLVPDPKSSEGTLNAINHLYPDLYRTGATGSISFKARLVHFFPGRGECEPLRLYHVTSTFAPASTAQ